MGFIPIQMIGTQRSGSNMLRLMLHELDGVTAPHPPHILERFMPLIPAFGDLSIAANFYDLVNHVCLLIEYNPVPWTGIVFDRGEIVKRCGQATLAEIQRVVYEMLAEHEGSKIWMCKSMASIHYVNELEERIKPFYLHLYRDGRDVALSFKKAVVGEKHIYCLAKQWKEEQELSLALFEQLGPQRVIQVKYEDLLADPQNELKKICSVLGILYKDKVLDFYKSDESKKTAQSGKMWENVEKPLISTNHDKFKSEMTEEDIRIFEQVAGKTLARLGYKLCFPDGPGISLTKETIMKFEEENKKLKAETLKNQKQEDIEKRKKQDELLKRVKSRMLSAQPALN